VEDHDDTRQALCDMLDMLGQKVTGTANASEALAALDRHPISLVLSDMHLDEGDGVSLAADIRKRKPDVKVILVTGDQRMLNTAGSDTGLIDGFLLKPVRLTDLQKFL
jgi:two-component system response regulator FlrC